MKINRVLCEKEISFKYAHSEYCEYRPYVYDESGGVLVCPLRYVDYEDGYSTSYSCLLDGNEAGLETKCRFKEERKQLEGKKLVKELKII